MISSFILFYGIAAILFFCVSLLTKPKFLLVTIPLNIVFLGFMLFSYTHFLGTALPYQYGIPFWKFQEFNAQNIAHVKGGVIDEELVHLLIQKKGEQTKYITLANTPELVAKLLKAEKERGGFDFDIFLDQGYGPGSGSNFKVIDRIEGNHSRVEEKLQTDEGIEKHDHDPSDKGESHS